MAVWFLFSEIPEETCGVIYLMKYQLSDNHARELPSFCASSTDFRTRMQSLKTQDQCWASFFFFSITANVMCFEDGVSDLEDKVGGGRRGEEMSRP